MRTAITIALAAATLALGGLAACSSSNGTTPLPGGPDASHDAPVTPGDGGGDAKPSGDGGDAGGEGGAGCGSDEAGTARSPFTCCVMGLIDHHSTATDLPDPGFCNGLADNPSDPAQFDKYFP